MKTPNTPESSGTVREPVGRRRSAALCGALALVMALTLSACGGGQDSTSLAGAQPVARSATASEAADNIESSPAAPSPSTVALQQEGARLNADELEAIAQTGVLPEAFDGPLLSGFDASASADTDASATKSLGAVRKSAASRVPVYRFFNTRTSAHFFTTSETERANLVATQPFMTYEGAAFYASATAVPGLSPVHRFHNNDTGVHFYTISESERAYIAANLPVFTYEGIAYHASTLSGTGYTPLYRFFYAARGFHFYTSSERERDNMIATMPQYTYEGVAYYVLGSDWQTPAVPHTGVTSNQCYQAGSDNLVACGSAGALALSPQQDGHRTAVNPMSYSLVGYSALPIGGGPPINVIYPTTQCVKDTVTGLVWEGKEATGTRAGSNTYTNHGDGRTGDASAYVNAVNAMRLCGYSDWRLPQADELKDLIHFGVTSGPRIMKPWFPNAQASRHWTKTAHAAYSHSAWFVSFDIAFQQSLSYTATRLTPMPVRLVRGPVWTGRRFVVTSKSHPGDTANNAVIDRKTGLIWRRCYEHESWLVKGCSLSTGTVANGSHEDVLVHATSLGGHWRVPNAKELGSLVDYTYTYHLLDRSAFPRTLALGWLVPRSSSPVVHDSKNAVSLETYQGPLTDFYSRSTGLASLLVWEP